MRLFADENTPDVIVQWLRDAGHDVTWAAELQPGETDEAWLSVAEAEGRLLITADKDFGDLVFRDFPCSLNVEDENGIGGRKSSGARGRTIALAWSDQLPQSCEIQFLVSHCR